MAYIRLDKPYYVPSEGHGKRHYFGYHGVLEFFRIVTMTIQTWTDRARTRAALRQLDPRLLDDIGVTRGDAMIEAEKPFWRA